MEDNSHFVIKYRDRLLCPDIRIVFMVTYVLSADVLEFLISIQPQKEKFVWFL